MDNILYISLNLILTVVSTMWIAKIFFKQRYLFIKPSIMLLSYTHVFFQWPLCFLSAYYFKTLKDPYTPAFLINGYVLIGLLISANTLQDKAKGIWDRISTPTTELHSKSMDSLIAILTIVIILVSIIYLCYVPFKETGLYAILNTSKTSNLQLTPSLARERSLKLLDSTTLRYLYTLCRTSIVPFLFSLITIRLFTMKGAQKFRYLVLELLALFSMITFVSFPGDRYALVMLILLAGSSLFWQKKLNVKFKTIAALMGCALLPAVFLSILREGRSILDISILLNYSQLILNRAFLVPLEVGMWYVDYAQNTGCIGIAAFPKIAYFLKIEPLNVPNMIGLKYCPAMYHPDAILPTVSAGAGYLLTYYGYLGIFSFPLSLFGLWFLDIALVVYSRLNNSCLIPIVASISVATLAFISSDYTVVLITHGYVGLLLVGLGSSKALDVTHKYLTWKKYDQPAKA